MVVAEVRITARKRSRVPSTIAFSNGSPRSMRSSIVLTKMIEIAVITPPVGLNLFAVISAADGRVRTGELFYGVLPFVIMECIVLVILLMFPAISTWLPQTMM